MTNKEAYEILGLADGVDLSEIKHAYRTLAFTLHPDLNPDLPSYLELLRVELAAGEQEEALRIGRFLIQAGRQLGDEATRRQALDLAAGYGLELKSGRSSKSRIMPISSHL